ncbi:SOS response-associated peptidase [Methylocella sp. CPCC 101449]|uniref:SOS response-associated peptidase n=1 Tax=Methylocella sp. CPCC 101449 TaxID=2987531 RepID=UPI00288F165D|nr:SOS response-associated peptidase [Methylocella sp. CPCC 101449]MDT2021223.1 SOS response-associated peptidase [Methylocella sp. CPCC 101449]
MCGRFSQAYTWEEVYAFSSGLTDARPVGAGNQQPRYNIAPTTDVQIIRRSADGGRELITARWGLVPGWWKKPLKGMPATFNARVETVETAAMFREAFKKRRCIIPASGFFEWTGPKADRTPHYFTARDRQILAFAGLWDRWKDESGSEIISCTIIVREADEWSAFNRTDDDCAQSARSKGMAYHA